MGIFTCHYCPTSKGELLAKDFIDSLDLTDRVKFFHKLEYLKEFGLSLKRPHAKYLGNKIHELRIQSDCGWIRIFYFFAGNREVFLTHGCIKKERKISPNVWKKAIKIRREYLERKRTGE